MGKYNQRQMIKNADWFLMISLEQEWVPNKPIIWKHRLILWGNFSFFFWKGISGQRDKLILIMSVHVYFCVKFLSKYVVFFFFLSALFTDMQAFFISLDFDQIFGKNTDSVVPLLFFYRILQLTDTELKTFYFCKKESLQFMSACSHGLVTSRLHKDTDWISLIDFSSFPAVIGHQGQTHKQSEWK